MRDHTVTATSSDAAELASDRRGHRRLAPSELVVPATFRIPDLPPVSLIDVSSGGALIEFPFQLRPESRLTLEVSTAAERVAVPFQLLRCYVSDIKGGVRYRAAGAFDRALAWPALSGSGQRPSTTDQLIVILRRLLGTVPNTDAGSRGACFDELVGAATAALQRGEPAAMVAIVTKAHLAQMFPTLVIHSGPFSMPRDTPASARFFGLEFRAATVLTAADRRFLRACAQLITLVDRRVERGTTEPAGLDVPDALIVRTVGEWQTLSKANGTRPISTLLEPLLVR